MQLYIIGNGFDLGHGLKTGYYDFREYLENNHSDFLEAFEMQYSLNMGDGKEKRMEFLWGDLEAKLAQINDIFMVENAANMELGLDGDDNYGTEDTMFYYYKDKLKYVEGICPLTKEWIGHIDISKTTPKTSIIVDNDTTKYISFNYTLILEEIYKISPRNILHIHGSISEKDMDPVIGHGDIEKIKSICSELRKAQNIYAEKETGAYRAIAYYLENSYKNTEVYFENIKMFLPDGIDFINVIGHSISEVDQPYFTFIDTISGNMAKWVVYYFSESDEEMLRNRIIACGVSEDRLVLKSTKEFYNC